MISALLRWSLGNRWVVLGIAAAVMVLGTYRASQMPVDVFPDLTAPRVTIVTESTGLAAEEVERLITYPIESAVNGATGVRRVRSASAPGISIVWVEFDWSSSPTVARQTVTERLQSVLGTLPPEASAPELAPASSVMGEIAFVALTSESQTQMALRRTAEVEVRRRLLAVEGVSQVVVIGGEDKEYQILLDPLRMEPFALTATEIYEGVERGSQNAPGGFVVDRGQESVVRILGRAHGIEDLRSIVVATRNGTAVRVRDVAEVVVGPGVARGAASYRGDKAVILSVVKQPSADTVSTTLRLDAALAAMGPKLGERGFELHRDIFRQLDFIDSAVDNLVEVMRDGAILVIVILFLFLWNVRPTLISVLAIPLSLVVAALALDALGQRIDTMTLGGLAIAIGELVDDAIVDVENVVRRLRERARLPLAERLGVTRTVYDASVEIRSSIVSATVVIMLVFVPLLFLDGIEGRLMRPLAIAYLVAIFASLVVAVTITPVLCALVLPSSVERRGAKESFLMRAVSRGYAPVLRIALQRPYAVASGVVVIVAVGTFALAGFGRAFLPEFNEGSLTIGMVLAPGTPLKDSDALAAMAERTLLADPAVVSTGRRTGRAERDEHVLGVESSEIEVRLDPTDPRTKAEVFADIRERLKAVPGAQFDIGQPISHRIEHMISGQRSALSIKVFGEDLRELRRIAAQLRKVAETVPGLVDVNVEQVVDIPQLVIHVDPHAASVYGLSTGAAAGLIGMALWGQSPGHIYEDGTVTEVVVKYPVDGTRDLEAIRRLPIPTPVGAVVPISALAEVRQDSGPNYVLRENVERRVVVTANIAGGSQSETVQALRDRIDAEVKVPAGVRIAYAGQFERADATGRRLLLLGLLSILGIAIVVGSTLRSVRRTAIVLVNLPMALAGGVIGVFLADGVLSIATTIGFITLFGIAVRNGILLATRTGDLELEGLGRLAAVERAAQERLAPILMTALTAALGLLPLAMALGQPGSEIQAPMALVILTGLSSSTVLNMIVVPSLMARWGGPPPRAP